MTNESLCLDTVEQDNEGRKETEAIIHYLRLRWLACYMLFVDDRLERADNAFYANADDIFRCIEKTDGFPDLSDRERSELFAEKLAKALEDFLSRARQDTSQLELDLAQKVTEISDQFQA